MLVTVDRERVTKKIKVHYTISKLRGIQGNTLKSVEFIAQSKKKTLINDNAWFVLA